MTVSLRRLTAPVFLSPGQRLGRGWEAKTATGMDDLELARLNRVNTRGPVLTPWEGMRQRFGPPRRP